MLQFNPTNTSENEDSRAAATRYPPHISHYNMLCIFCQQEPRRLEIINTVLDCQPSEAYTSPYIVPTGRQFLTKWQGHDRPIQLQWVLCFEPRCEQCSLSVSSITFHTDCHAAFRNLWKGMSIELLPPKRRVLYNCVSIPFRGRSRMKCIELPPSSPRALFNYVSILKPWLSPSKMTRIPLDQSSEHLLWSRGLKRLSLRAAKPTKLSKFVGSLSTLPLELLGLILVEGGEDIFRSVLFRYVVVAHVTDALSGQEEQISEFLDNQYMVSKEDAASAEVVGVDHLGVRMVPDNCQWYLRVKDVELHYQAPFLRPLLNREVKVWDVPNPPVDGSYRFHGAEKDTSNPKQIRCINLSNLVGLTFFCIRSVVFAIHQHETHHSSALETYLALSPNRDIVLLYLPLNMGLETIEQIWIREGPPFVERSRKIMIRTSHRILDFGKVDYSGDYYYHQLTEGPVTSLLYYAPGPNQPISVYGAVSEPLPANPDSEPQPPLICRAGDMLSAYRNQASLVDVIYVELYTHPLENNKCSGMLVRHSDGREESLGQRLAGLPDVVTTSVSNPAHIHHKALSWRSPSGDHQRHVKLAFSSPDSPETLEVKEDYGTEAMDGVVVWYIETAWWHDEIHFVGPE